VPRRGGPDEGATSARAGFVVAVAHGGIPRRRRRARIVQSLARCDDRMMLWPRRVRDATSTRVGSSR